jgi:hypothetical protein
MYRSRLTKIVLCLGTLITGATSAPDQTCKRLIPVIAKEVEVPSSLLLAISFVESGFHPYVLNHDGESLSFSSAVQSLDYAQTQIAQGNTNIDIGCMQINWKAHQHKFDSPRELLVPTTNIRYAAKFLKTLYKEFGSWSKAVSAYHSRNKAKSKSYLIKIAQFIQNQYFHSQEGSYHDQTLSYSVSYSGYPLYRAKPSLVRPTLLCQSLDFNVCTQRVSQSRASSFASCSPSNSVSPFLSS